MSDSTVKYFDLHTTGLGYLYRAREVKVRKGPSFFAVDISALQGSTEDRQFVRFDCKATGALAEARLIELMPAIEGKKNVLVGFKLGDLYVDTFTYDKGEKIGQTGVSLKARLLQIRWAKVDGEDFVFQAQPESAAETDEAA